MKPIKRTAPAILAVLAAGLIGWTACSTGSVRAGTRLKASDARKEAPDFALRDSDGRLVHLKDYRGKVVLLDFWATWCGPCRVEIPYFTEFERSNKDRGFAVLGVAMDDDGWESVRPFLKELSVNYRVVIGDDKTSDQYGGIEALPTTYLIDRDGRIASTHIGLTPKKEFENAIEQLLQDGHSSSASRSGPDGASAETNGVRPAARHS